MNLMEAIDKRISCRAYVDKPLEEELLSQLSDYIDALNAESGLHFQLYGPRTDSPTAIDMAERMFAGPVYCYAALVAPDTFDAGEKVGYYGEKLVLFATQLGLGTCWVASTYNASTTRVNLEEGERLWDVVPIGYAVEKVPMKQRVIRATIRKSDKKPQQLVKADCDYANLPEWFRSAIDAVIAGPSAVNEQPVVFYFHDGVITAELPNYKRDLEYNDLGIAKLHFEIAAASHGVNGTWDWGAGAEFKM